jgi:hypothetical protein
MKRKYYILYKTTNLKNNKFYIGVHETTNLNDGYLGSGKKFRNSLYYHGKENFKREILEYFDNSTEMYQRESEIVNEELLKNPKCLNLKLGGFGGFTYDYNNQLYASSILQERLKDIKFKKQFCNSVQIGVIKSYTSGNRKKMTTNGWVGKTHTDETKRKMRKPKNIGNKNSQYGTCWITNEKENRKIYKGDEIPKGFKLGRKQSLDNDIRPQSRT